MSELCDVCEAPASLLCSECHQAVYCSTACQAADLAEHQHYDCVHPADMDAERVAQEIQMHLDHADEHDDPAFLALGASILERGAHDVEGRAYLEDALDAHWGTEELVGGLFNRSNTTRRIQRKRRRMERRNLRKAKRYARRNRTDARRARRHERRLKRGQKTLTKRAQQTAVANLKARDLRRQRNEEAMNTEAAERERKLTEATYNRAVDQGDIIPQQQQMATKIKNGY